MLHSHYSPHAARHHVGLILALVGLMCGVTLLLGSARVASAQAVAPSWSYTGDFRTMVNGFVNSTEYRLRFGLP